MGRKERGGWPCGARAQGREGVRHGCPSGSSRIVRSEDHEQDVEREGAEAIHYERALQVVLGGEPVVVDKMALLDEARAHVDDDVADEPHVDAEVEPEPPLRGGEAGESEVREAAAARRWRGDWEMARRRWGDGARRETRSTWKDGQLPRSRRESPVPHMESVMSCSKAISSGTEMPQ